jgi:predicted  nucleic acid-binding Zn-ribbon protein
MGFIEEGRQLIQDFVTPEIRAMEARFDAIEKQVTALDSKTGKLDAKIDRNQVQVLDAIHRMEKRTAVMERVARLESKMQNVA